MGPFVPKVASILILPLITKHLTNVDYGIYGTLMAYMAGITALRTLGLGVSLSNHFYHSPGMYKWAWRQIYGFLFFWNIPFSILAIGLVLFAIPPEANHNKWLICALLVIPNLISGSSSMFGNLYYQVHQKPKQIASRNIVFGFINIAVTYYTIAVLKIGYMGWFWAAGITGLLTNLSYFFPLFYKEKIKPIFNFKWRLMKKQLAVSLPQIPHQYAYYLLNSSDRIVMDNTSFSQANIGNYNVAYTFGSYFAMGIEAMSTTLSPMFKAMLRAKDEKTLRDIGLFWLAFTLTLSFIISMFLKEIFQLLFSNESLWQNYYLGVLIIMAMNYRPIYSTFVSRLFYFERTNTIWQITLVAGLINVILNIFLLKKFGIEFAALTTFIAFMYMAYAGFFYKNLKDLVTENYHPITCLLITILYTIIARWAVLEQLTTRIICAVLACIIFVFYLFKNKHLLKRLQLQNY